MDGDTRMNKQQEVRIVANYAKIILMMMDGCTKDELAIMLDKDIKRADMLEKDNE